MNYNFNEEIERISDKCRKWDYDYICSRFGQVPKDFIPFWIADMDFKAAPEIISEFKRIVEHGTFGYTYCFDEFYQAVIEFHKKRHFVDIKRDWITLSYGTVSTLHYTVQAFCQAGDYVIMNTPVYDPFAGATTRQGVNIITSPLIAKNNRYYLDFAQIEKELKEKQPKLYLFCSPHNPSGRIWDKDEIIKIAKLCQQYHTILVVDEVHSEHIINGHFTPALSISEDNILDNLILLTSPNKAFNLGGLKTSYSMIPNPQIRQKFRHQLEKNSITSPNMFGVWGIIAAYNHGLIWLDQVTDYIRNNIDYFITYIEQNFPQLSVMPVESSYLAWVNISQTGLTATEFTHKLAKEIGVLAEDGSHFVADGEDYVRFNLGTRFKLIEEALKRMKTIL